MTKIVNESEAMALAQSNDNCHISTCVSEKYFMNKTCKHMKIHTNLSFIMTVDIIMCRAARSKILSVS